jgi:hypothetical protein
LASTGKHEADGSVTVEVPVGTVELGGGGQLVATATMATLQDVDTALALRILDERTKVQDERLKALDERVKALVQDLARARADLEAESVRQGRQALDQSKSHTAQKVQEAMIRGIIPATWGVFLVLVGTVLSFVF